MRALFTTLQAERVGGESDADPALPHLPFMKEKYGQLRIDFDLYSDYQLSVGWFFEELSGGSACTAACRASAVTEIVCARSAMPARR